MAVYSDVYGCMVCIRSLLKVFDNKMRTKKKEGWNTKLPGT